MKYINKTEREILVILCKGNKTLDSYTLFRRLRIGFAEFTHSINSLLKKSYIGEEDNNIKLTTKGLELVSLGYKGSDTKQWRSIPTRFVKNSLSPNEFYVPNRKLLDKRTFKKTNFEIE